MDAVSVKDVTKKYSMEQDGAGKEITVLDRVSLKVRKGESVGILGPNGCGKTTLLKLIVGVEKPDAGSIIVSGKAPEDARVGYVPQHNSGSLYPWFTAVENVAFADALHPAAICRASNKLAEFGLGEYATAYPYQLSGGLKQLVAIARATIGSNVFLFDEPLNALDHQNRVLVEQVFLKLRGEGSTILLVSHDIESTVLLCDKIVVLSEKPTCIKAVLPVNLPEERDSETRFSPAFNLISHQVFQTLKGG